MRKKELVRKIIVLITIIVIVIISAASVYVIKKDDGTYKEDDWKNTQFASEQFVNSTTIDNDGKMSTTMTAQEVWDKLKANNSRVSLYLNGPEELAKLMNAEMVTQYLDTRKNPDEEYNWDDIKNIDVNSKDVHGIVKLKRAGDDGKTNTMKYVDPETFQSYIDAYNESGSEADKNRALSYFTLEETVSGDTSDSTSGELQTIDGVDMQVLTTNGLITVYNGDGSAMEGGSNDRFGQPLADGKVAARGIAPDKSVIYIQSRTSGEGSHANGKFYYICDTGGGLSSNQVDIYVKASQSVINRSPYGSYHKAKISLVEKNVTWKQYLSKYYNKTVGNGSTSGTSSNSDKTTATFLEKLKEQYQQINSNWTYSRNSPNKSKKRANCASTVSWALQEMGVLKKGQNVYINSKNKISNESKLSKYMTKIDGQGKTMNQLIKEGKLQEGDIVFWKNVVHTNVYAGNKKWYDSGTSATNKSTRHYTKDLTKPRKVSYLNNGSQKIYAIYRFNDKGELNNSSADTNNTNSDSSNNTTKVSENANSVLYWPTLETDISSSDSTKVDIKAKQGEDVFACETGTVKKAGNSKSAGKVVEIDHGNGYISKYKYNSEILVSVGDAVKKGQVIARTGKTGNAKEEGVEFQIEYNGSLVDPMSFKYENGLGSGTGGFAKNSKETAKSYVAKVATWNERTEKIQSNDPDIQGTNRTVYDMTSTDINYKELISGYTMPFDYLWDLLVMSEDKSFVMDLADLVLNSQLEITVHDNLTVDTNVNVKTYTKKKKTITNATVRVEYGDSADSTQSHSRTGGPWDDIESTDYKTTSTTITKTNTLDVSLTKADVWIVKYTKNYKYEVPDKTVTNSTNTLDDTPYPDSPNDTGQSDTYSHGADLLAEEESKLKASYNYVDGNVTSIDEKIYNGTFNKKENITDTVETKKYVEQPSSGVKEKTDPNSKEPNFVNILLKNENQKAKHSILGAPKWLFNILQGNKSTANMVDLTKYLLYKATNDTKFWDANKEFDFSIFDPDNFVTTSEAGGDFVVKTDASGAAPVVTDKAKLEEGLKKWLKSNSKQRNNALSVVDTVLQCQEENKVNAVFVYAFLRQETGIGSANTAHVKTENNWGSWNLGHVYSSPEENIKTITNGMQNGNIYFKKGNTTVSKIGAIYCPNEPSHPNQGDDWIQRVNKNMSDLYSCMGIQTSVSGGSGSVAKGGAGTTGVYTSTKGKKYNLYLQGSGAPWANNDYGDSHSMAYAGCGPTAEAIIASAYNANITPETARADIVKHLGRGNHSNATWIGQSFKRLVPNVKTSVGNFVSTKVKSCLNSGGQVWLVVQNCKYTSGAHCMALIDYKESNQVYVAHGNSKRRPSGWDSISAIKSYLKYSSVLYVGGN